MTTQFSSEGLLQQRFHVQDGKAQVQWEFPVWGIYSLCWISMIVLLGIPKWIRSLAHRAHSQWRKKSCELEMLMNMGATLISGTVSVSLTVPAGCEVGGGSGKSPWRRWPWFELKDESESSTMLFQPWGHDNDLETLLQSDADLSGLVWVWDLALPQGIPILRPDLDYPGFLDDYGVGVGWK